MRAGTGWMEPCHQRIQQDTQSIDIGRNGRGRSRQLLGSGVFGRHRPPTFHCLQPCSRLVAIFEQLGNPEIEQFHPTVVPDQDVRRLEVPVHNRIGVRMGDRVQHVEKQPDTRFDIEPVLIAVIVDVVALDVLENEIGLSDRRYACVEQLGDVRMGQTAEDHALPLESVLAAPPNERDFEKLNRYFSRESRVVSFREPDAPHATLTDLCYQTVRSHRLTVQAGC